MAIRLGGGTEKGLLQNRGFGEPRTSATEKRDILAGFQIWMGVLNVFDGFFFWELQKGKKHRVFLKTICLLDFFLNKIDRKR